MKRYFPNLARTGLTVMIFSLMAFHTGSCYTPVGARFLLIAPDARAHGMGEGGSVFSDGAKSAYYNPANLVSSGLISADISFFNYLPALTDDLSYKSIYIAGHANGPYYWGAGFNHYDLGQRTRFDEGRGYISVDNYYEAFSLYGAAKDGNSSLGIGIKYIKSQILDGWGGVVWEARKPSSFAIDLGYQTRNHFPQLTLVGDKVDVSEMNDNQRLNEAKGVSLGISVLNIGPDMEYGSYWTERLPRKLLIAAGYQIVNTRYYDLKLTIDAGKFLIDNDSGFDGEWDEIDWSYGLELQYYNIITLRGGAHNDRDGHQRYWTSGAGLGPDWLHADFSYVSKSNETWNDHGGEYTVALAFNISHYPH